MKYLDGKYEKRLSWNPADESPILRLRQRGQEPDLSRVGDTAITAPVSPRPFGPYQRVAFVSPSESRQKYVQNNISQNLTPKSGKYNRWKQRKSQTETDGLDPSDEGLGSEKTNETCINRVSCDFLLVT